jgi:protease YdgD
MKSASAVALAALLALGTMAAAPPLPGIETPDHRVAVDPDRPPWDAVVKVQTNVGTRCTGVLIAPATVLTAGHCLYNRLTRAFLEPGSLHVLFGYERGVWRLHLRVAGYQTGAGVDWARLDLAHAAPPAIVPLALAGQVPAPGAAVAIAGYNQDRGQLLMADLSCRITGFARWRNERLLLHDCSATRGTSGGPLLARRDGRWLVVGINIGASPAGNLALPATETMPRRAPGLRVKTRQQGL